MSIRQRNIHPNSALGEEYWEFNVSAITADAADSIYLHDVERLEITEVGWAGTALAGTSPTITPTIKYGNDALDPDDPATGTAAYAASGDYIADTAWPHVKRFHEDGGDNPVILGQPQTVNNTDRRGIMLKVVADLGGTVTNCTGKVFVRYRAFRSEDL